jgi:hypothetical protein
MKDPTFDSKNQEKQEIVAQLFKELSEGTKDILREINTHKMFTVTEFSKTENNLKEKEDLRYEQQLE